VRYRDRTAITQLLEQGLSTLPCCSLLAKRTMAGFGFLYRRSIVRIKLHALAVGECLQHQLGNTFGRPIVGRPNSLVQWTPKQNAQRRCRYGADLFRVPKMVFIRAFRRFPQIGTCL
jgi:hypothetical protein